MYMIDSTLPD